MKILLPRALASILLAACGVATHLRAQSTHFDVNDVSWLFPFPSKAEDLDGLISMETLKTEDGQLLWPQAVFEGLKGIARSNDAAVAGAGRINLPGAVDEMATWKIAGVRFDPCAPGTAPEIVKEFGSNPQIRLILQPVTGTPPRPHDIAVHVIYNFSSSEATPPAPNRFPKAVPDEAAFLEIVKDLAAVKALSAKLGATTAGKDMGVHPGLASASAAAEVRKAMKAALLKHVPKGKLRAMAIMGLPGGPEPWIFVAIVPTPDGKFTAAPGFNTPSPKETAQALSFITPTRVLPTPITNNRAPIINQIMVPPALRRGVSTAVLFKNGVDLAAKAEIGKGADGQPILDDKATNSDIVDIVGHPALSHFFNADCVSCHTETTRAGMLGIKQGDFAFKKASDLSELSDAVTPKTRWNVRNFGWGPPSEKIATVSRRAFNETAESAEFINKNYIPKLAP